MRATSLPFRYAGWITRDVLLGLGLIMVGIVALTVFGMSRVEVTVTPESGHTIATQLLRQVLFPLVLVATAGIVSSDLSHGYYRSWFSRPVSPPLFYLQRWLLGGALILAFVPAISLAIATRSRAMQVSGDHVVKAGLLYLLLGGTVFLLSTLTRRDWLFAALLYAMEVVLHFLRSSGAHLGAVGRLVYTILPPYHVASIERPVPAGAELWGAVAWGAGLVLAALAVLRWRPLGSGGRA
jgi:ABC-type transport system involved in multi-copper enzyme maturation permease subunit